MKIIIAGGTGALGSALAASLAEDGHQILVLSRFPDNHQALRQDGIRVLGWDARTEAGWLEEAEGAEAIVNFAGAPLPGEGFFPKRWTPARRQVILDSRRQAGEAVTSAVQMAKNKPRLVVQASAIGYYGPNPSGRVTALDPPGNDFLANVCRAWEEATAPIEAEGVRRVIVRTGIVLDPGAGALPRLMLPFKLFAGGRMGSGAQWMSWIHPADELGAIRFLMDHETCTGPYNLTAPHPVTNQEFAQTLGRVMRRPAFIPVPAFALRTAFGEVATTVLDGQQAVPDGLAKAGYSFMYPKLEGALRDLLG